MNFFDFLKEINAVLSFQGSFDETNTYVNAYIHIENKEIRLCKGSLSCRIYGRDTSKPPRISGAIEDLVRSIKGQKIQYLDKNDNPVTILVPNNLVVNLSKTMNLIRCNDINNHVYAKLFK